MSDNQDVLSSDPEEEQSPGRGIPIARGRPDYHRRMNDSVVSDDDDPLSPIGSPLEVSGFGGRGKYLELRRKLQEDQANRLNENQTDSSSHGVIDVETLLESIKNDLETRDQSRSAVSSIRNLETHPKFLEMYQQIKERDHTILNLESRLNDMDRQVIDLQDTVSQRDKLIGSKNEAVSVVHSKYQKELVAKEDELRKTQETMISLEKNLSGIQDQWKADKNRLNEEIKTHRNALDNLTDTNKALEAKCDVIQEELARIQREKEESLALLLKKDEQIVQIESKLKEATEASEKSSQQLQKLKVQFQTKLKAMKEKNLELTKQAEDAGRVQELENRISELEQEKQMEAVQKAEAVEKVVELENRVTELEQEKLQIQELAETVDDSEKIKELENRIAELEEEKGTLLLQQIDFDEEQLGQEQLKSRIMDLESQVEASSETIKSLNASISQLESERDQLNSELIEIRDTYNEVQRSAVQIEQLQAASVDVIDSEQSSTGNGHFWKVEKNTWNEDIANQNSDESVLSEKRALEEELNRIRQSNEEYMTVITQKENEAAENKVKLEEMEKALETSKTQVNRLKVQYQTKLKALREKQREITENSPDSGRVVELETRIAELESGKGDRTPEPHTISPDSNAHAKLAELEAQARISADTIANLTQNIISIETERERITSELYAKEDKLEEMQNQVTELQAEIIRLQQWSNIEAKSYPSFTSAPTVLPTETVEISLQDGPANNEDELRRLLERSENQVLELKAEICQLRASVQAQPAASAGFSDWDWTPPAPLEDETVSIETYNNRETELLAEISRLQQSSTEIEELRAKTSELLQSASEVESLKTRIAELEHSEHEVVLLQAEITQLQESSTEIELLKAEIERLQASGAGTENPTIEVLGIDPSRVEELLNENVRLRTELSKLEEGLEVAKKIQKFERNDFSGRIEAYCALMEKVLGEKNRVDDELAKISKQNQDHLIHSAGRDEQIKEKSDELVEQFNSTRVASNSTEDKPNVPQAERKSSVDKYADWDGYGAHPAFWETDAEDFQIQVTEPIQKSVVTTKLTALPPGPRVEDLQAELDQLQQYVIKLEQLQQPHVVELEQVASQVEPLQAEVRRLQESLAHALQQSGNHSHEPNTVQVGESFQTLQAENATLTYTLSRAEEEWKAEKEYLNQLITLDRGKLQELKEQRDALEARIQQLTTELETILKDKDSLMSERDSKVAELQETADKATLLAAKLKAQYQAKLKAIQEKNKESVKEPEDPGRIKELENRIGELEEENGKLHLHQMFGNEGNKSKVEELQSQIAEHSVTIANLTQNIISIETERERLTAELYEAQDKCNELQQSAHLQEQLQAEVNRLHHFETEVQRLQGELSRVQQSAYDSEKLLTEMVQELEAHVQDLTAQNSNLPELQKQVETLTAENSRLQTSTDEEMGKRREEVDRLQQLSSSQAQDLENSRSQIQQLEAQITQLQSDKHDLQQSADHLKEYEIHLQESRNLVDQLQGDLARMHEYCSQIPELQAKAGRLEDAENRVVQLQAEIERLQNAENQIVKLQTEIERLLDTENQVIQLQSEIQRLRESENQIPDLHSEIERLRGSASQVDSLRAEVERLQYAENQVLQLQGEISRLQDSTNHVIELQAKISQLEESASQLEPLKSEIARLQEIASQVERLQREASELQHKAALVDQLQAEVQRLQQQAAYQAEQLDAEVSRLAQESDHFREECNTLQDRMKYVAEEKLSLEMNMTQLEQQVAEQWNLINTRDLEIQNKNKELENLSNLLAQTQASARHQAEPTSHETLTRASQVSQSVDSFMTWEDSQGQKSPTSSGWWSGCGGFDESQPPVVEETVTKKRPFLTNEETHSAATNKVYELEVKLTEVQMNLEEANATLEMVSYENSRLQEENSHLKRETEVLKEKIKVSMSISPSPEPSESTQGQGESNQDHEEAKKKLTAEVHELKLRNAKMIQKFKQLKEKYDALLKANDKKTFSLESAMEDELVSLVKQKDEALEENSKIINELRGEKESLAKKVDVIERANEKLIELKEYQERRIDQLTSEVKQLQQEISGLKWHLEEVENMANSGEGEAGGDGFSTYNEDSNIVRQQNLIAAQEIQHLQQENANLVATVQHLNARNQELSQQSSVPLATAVPAPVTLDAVDAQAPPVVATPAPAQNSTATVATGTAEELAANLQTLQQCFEQEVAEKAILERKIELLQGKIHEIEQSEMKCFEESLMLKSWTRQLEVDNQKFQLELEQLYGSAKDGDMNNVKVKTLQNEVIRLVDVLQDRDKRCEQLTSEITRLLEERDGLQLKLSNVLQHNISLHEENNKGKEGPDEGEAPIFDRAALQTKLAELEDTNYVINIDLRREREARRLVQEQLFFSQSTRGIRGEIKRPPMSPTSSSASAPSTPKFSAPRTPIISPAQFVPIQPAQPSTRATSASDPPSESVSNL